jgi:hypothetical protein
MKYAACASTLLLGGFLAMTPTCARAAGQGGGHGGSGGHGSGGHAGHLSGGSSSGRSSGHSIGHSLAHIFGHHGQGVSLAALKGAPPEHGKVTPSLESIPRVLDRQPRNRFVSAPPICFFPRRRAFGFGGCPYGWVAHNFSFGGNWNCSNDGFFFDPFFSGWFFGPVPYGSAFGGATWFKDGTAPDSTVQSPAEPTPVYPPTDSHVTDETPERLTDYWVSDGELHYTTTYGGQNSLPFERIDLEKTVQLNADRYVPLVLLPQAVPR